MSRFAGQLDFSPTTDKRDDLLLTLHLYAPGPDNALSRRRLCGLHGIEDRTLRKFVEQLRREGNCIVDAKGGGYYVSDETADAHLLVDHYRRRAQSLLVTANMFMREFPGMSGKQLRVVLQDAGA